VHERSLVKSLLDEVGRLAADRGGGQVEEIRVSVGPLSGVEPVLLEDAFAQLSAESPAAGSRLVVEEVSLIARCEACDAEFEPEGFMFLCPRCDSGRVRVLQGDALILQSVTLLRPEGSLQKGRA
jgi:hydrogenase nickel incorporation protein HypA/HybF